jgi:CubicO group peptidase (beta-lactamase class C family)
LDALWSDLLNRRTTALLVIRNDKIVFERYAGTNTQATKHYSASMAKALVGGVSLALALTDGRIALDDPASKYVPQWASHPSKSKITIRQLGSHTSGLADAEQAGLADDKLTGWQGDFWKRLPPPNDPFTIARDTTPVIFAPGSNFQYSNPGMAMLAYAITAALKDAPEKDLRTLLRERVMRPIGVPDSDWSIGYDQTVTVDALSIVATWGGGNFTPRAVARIGRLMLRKGNWEGKQLISSKAVEQTTTDAGTPHNCGIGWWSNNDGTVEKLPRDAFWGSGAGHQVLLLIPSLNLIAVRNGETLNPAKDYDAALREHFFEPLVLAVARSKKTSRVAPPYPASSTVKEVIWPPKKRSFARLAAATIGQ